LFSNSSKGGATPLAILLVIEMSNKRIGGRKMLETAHERVKLLRAGIDGKTIEKLYLIFNNFDVKLIKII
jgi:hypothetical protein